MLQHVVYIVTVVLTMGGSY